MISKHNAATNARNSHKMCFGSEPPLDVRSAPVLIAWGNLTFLECTDRCEVITSLIPTVASSVIFCRKRELNLGEKVDTAKPNTPPLGMYGRPFHPARVASPQKSCCGERQTRKETIVTDIAEARAHARRSHVAPDAAEHRTVPLDPSALGQCRKIRGDKTNYGAPELVAHHKILQVAEEIQQPW